MKSIINKITAALLPLILVFGLAACSDVKTADKAVLTSFYPVYLIAERLVEGTDISLMNMARPQTGCLHDYQLTSLDMRLLSKSKAVIINGAGMEHSFIERAVENTGIKVIDSSDGLFGTEGEAVGHEEAFHSHDGHDHELNSHIWMSLKMAKAQAENICAGLIGLYPQYKKELESNKELFLADIASLEKLEDSENEGGEFNVISFNEAFHYLLEENGAFITAEIEIDENVTPTARELAEMTDSAGSLNVKAVFCADDNGRVFAETVGRELDIPVYILDPLTYTVSSDDYIKAMERNILTVSEAKNR